MLTFEIQMRGPEAPAGADPLMSIAAEEQVHVSPDHEPSRKKSFLFVSVRVT